MNRKLLLYIVPLVIIWGSMAGILLIPLERLSVPMVVLFNLATGLIFLIPYLAFTGGFRILAQYSPSQWLRLVLAGCVGCFFYYAFYFFGLKIGGAGSAIEVSLMNYLYPIMTVIFSAVILRERVTPLGVLSILISFAGGYLIISRGRLFHINLEAWRALLFGLAAAVSWGLFSALGRKWTNRPVPAIFVYYLTGLVLAVLWVLWDPRQLTMPTAREFACMAYAGAVSNCLGAILWFSALQVSNATLVGNIAYSGVFLNVLVIHFIAGAPIRPSSLVGLGLISVGVLLAGRHGSVSTPVKHDPGTGRPLTS